ncbi:hypothetical protein, conserved [Eimeria maxima]|uniref:Uncharacterized protein n=1 Tax=Eimeria maxima TaxID=5804 RepID=U6MGQ2_EIMMA|nr:hypothetical protein, conserved [Eimeria maxima]CDJ60825.1 hypothetical protein, conserved [Eimeria maxima]
MQIRELAAANPEALKGAGVYMVYAPTPGEDDDPKKKAAAQGVLDIAMGIDSPAASLQRKSEKKAENELSAMMSPANQEDLERTMSPQERMNYDQQRIAQLRHEIGIQRKTVERARALIA